MNACHLREIWNHSLILTRPKQIKIKLEMTWEHIMLPLYVIISHLYIIKRNAKATKFTTAKLEIHRITTLKAEFSDWLCLHIKLMKKQKDSWWSRPYNNKHQNQRLCKHLNCKIIPRRKHELRQTILYNTQMKNKMDWSITLYLPMEELMVIDSRKLLRR